MADSLKGLFVDEYKGQITLYEKYDEHVSAILAANPAEFNGIEFFWKGIEMLKKTELINFLANNTTQVFIGYQTLYGSHKINFFYCSSDFSTILEVIDSFYKLHCGCIFTNMFPQFISNTVCNINFITSHYLSGKKYTNQHEEINETIWWNALLEAFQDALIQCPNLQAINVKDGVLNETQVQQLREIVEVRRKQIVGAQQETKTLLLCWNRLRSQRWNRLRSQQEQTTINLGALPKELIMEILHQAGYSQAHKDCNFNQKRLAIKFV